MLQYKVHLWMLDFVRVYLSNLKTKLPELNFFLYVVMDKIQMEKYSL